VTLLVATHDNHLASHPVPPVLLYLQVGLYCINVLTLLDLATISVESYPFFCNAWAVIGAVAEVLREQQAAPAAAAAAAASATAASASAAAAASRGGEGQGAGAASVTTRSSARRARGK
jgi:ribosomal protein L12E/L44/L45/RPP1/RPP2